MARPAQLRHDRSAATRHGLRAVLFDWDGTLSDSRQVLLEAWHASTELVLGRRFPAAPEDEDVVFTLPGAEIWPAITADAEQADRLAAAFQEAYADAAGSLSAFPGIPEVLVELREHGIKIGIVTSKGRRRFVPDSERIRIGHLIDVAVCAGEAAAAKPDPASLLTALDGLGVGPAQAAMVGDTVVDVTAGRAAGTITFGVAWGHGTPGALLAAGAEWVAAGAAELLERVLASEPGGER
ncbi:MAG TPA: HAD family hydrolase [Solirubrobacteraceae bacterium]|nr:HAD family hydrolase [Solirubrobacteraceae bacterium]